MLNVCKYNGAIAVLLADSGELFRDRFGNHSMLYRVCQQGKWFKVPGRTIENFTHLHD